MPFAQSEIVAVSVPWSPLVGILSVTWLVCACAAGAAQTVDVTPRSKVKKIIADFENKSPAAVSLGITKYTLNGQPLWLLPTPCCDHFNYLYTADGVAVCAPSGGIAGSGNGKCPAGISPVGPSTSAPSR